MSTKLPNGQGLYMEFHHVFMLTRCREAPWMRHKPLHRPRAEQAGWQPHGGWPCGSPRCASGELRGSLRGQGVVDPSVETVQLRDSCSWLLRTGQQQSRERSC
jgi:hypothetical protein